MKHCNGPCNQGRAPCPTPEACQLEDREDDKSLTAAGLAVMLGAVILLMVSASVWIA
mgnify:CR=1 FL=1